VAGAMLVLLGAKTLAHIPVYRTEVAVVQHAYILFPDWNITSFNYAITLIEQGEIDRARVLLDSEPALSRPAWVLDYLHGSIALEEGKTTEALSKLQRSLWLSASGGYFPYAAVPLARAYRESGNSQQSLAVLEAVLHSSIHNPLEYYRAKRMKEAIIQERQ
jgi:predicted Zn-dependent protease